MPRVPVKPLIKLSKEQYKVLLERLIRKAGKFTYKAAGAVMNRPFEPPVTREVGTLYKRMAEGEGLTAEQLPIEEARAKFAAAPPQTYVGETWGAPEAKVMSTVAPGSPEELAAGLAYERVKQVPIVRPVSRTARVMQRDIEATELEAAIRRLGINPEDVRPGVKLQTIIEEQGRKPRDMITVPPAAELASDAKIADRLWKNMGGTKSVSAKVWDIFRSTQRREEHIRTTRDYFISSFVRWRQAPRKFANTHPNEARVLDQLWREFEKSLEPQPTAIPGTVPPGGVAGGGVAVGGVE